MSADPNSNETVGIQLAARNDELEVLVGKLKVEVENANVEISCAKENALMFEEARNSAESAVDDVSAELAKCKEELRMCMEEKASLDEKLSVTNEKELQVEELLESLADTAKLKEGLELDIRERDELIASLKSDGSNQCEQLKEELSVAVSQRGTLEAEVSELKIALVAAEGKLADNEQAVASLSSLSASREELALELQEASASRSVLEAELLSCRAELETARSNAVDFASSQAALVQEISQYKAIVVKLEERLVASQASQSGVEDGQLEIQQLSLDLKMSQNLVIDLEGRLKSVHSDKKFCTDEVERLNKTIAEQSGNLSKLSDLEKRLHESLESKLDLEQQVKLAHSTLQSFTARNDELEVLVGKLKVEVENANVEISCAKENALMFEEARNSAESAVDDVSAELAKCKEELRMCMEEKASLDEKLSVTNEKELQVEELLESLADTAKLKEGLELDIRERDELIASLKSDGSNQCEQLKEELSVAVSQRGTLEAEVSELKIALVAAEGKLADNEQAVASLSSLSASREELALELQEASASRSVLEAELLSCRAELETARSNAVDFASSQAAFKEERSKFENELQKCNLELQLYEEKIRDADAQFQTIMATLEEKEKICSQHQEELDKFEHRNQELLNELTRVRNERVDETKNVNDELLSSRSLISNLEEQVFALKEAGARNDADSTSHLQQLQALELEVNVFRQKNEELNSGEEKMKVCCYLI